MRIRRTLPVVSAVCILAAAVTLAVQLRKHAPPEPARLLPGADAFLYFDLNKVRKANAGKDLPAVSHDPGYERFIRETGVLFERDLDEAALAVHYPAAWGGTGGSAVEPRFSEVLVGKFHGERLSAYLRRIAESVVTYHSVEIFTVRMEGRSLRICVLAPDSVGASNHDDPAVIQGIIDRTTRLASPFGGPALLRQHYKHVQLASLAWAVARVQPSPGTVSVWSNIFTRPATLVVSGSYLTPLHLRADAIHLRAEVFTLTSDDARALAEKLTSVMAVAQTAETSFGTSLKAQGADADWKAVFDSLKIKQDGERAVLTASIPFSFLRRVLAGSATESGQSIPSPEPPASKASQLN